MVLAIVTAIVYAMATITRRGLIAGLAAAGAQPRWKRRRHVGMQPDLTGVFPFVIVGGSGASSGVFVYDPVVAQGDLIASITDALTSPTGDTTKQGITAYNQGNNTSIQLHNATVDFGSTAAATRITVDGLLTLFDALADNVQPEIDMSAPATAGGNPGNIGLFGPSKDATKPGQVLVSASGSGVAVPLTTSLLEVQGAIQTTALAAILASGDLTSQLGNVTAQSGQVIAATAGSGFRAKEGVNAKQGTATLAGGTKLVANTAVTANSRIFLTAQDNNSTGALRVSARVAGTSFTITSSNAADSGVVAFQIFEPA